MRLFAGTPWDVPPRCERCGLLEADCSCPPEPALRVPPEKQTARLSVEKRKKGKQVTVIRGLTPTAAEAAELLTKLKSQCGAGGSVQEGVLEIQGSHQDRVRDLLRQWGYRVQG